MKTNKGKGLAYQSGNLNTGTSDDWFLKTYVHWLNECRNKQNFGVFVKRSELGGGADNPFEQSFANLAHTYLRDKAPNLLDYEVGFQLIEKNQENTKAVGVFGFKVGDQWLMAPTFFLNGDLKGHELLYIKNQDLFVPMKDNWLNYLLGRKQNVLGRMVSRNSSNLGVVSPNLYRLARSPYKFASAVKMAAWMDEFLPVIGHLATTDMSKEARYADNNSVLDAIQMGGAAAFEWLEKVAESYPIVYKAIDELYGTQITAIAKAASFNKPVSQSILNQLAQPVTQPTKSGSITGSILKNVFQKQAADPTLYNKEPTVVLRHDYANGGQPDVILSEKERRTVLQEGRLVKDERKSDAVAKAYDLTTSLKLYNPTETGIYEVLVKPHEFKKCLIINAPFHTTGRGPYVTVVALEGEGKKSWVNVHSSCVFVRSQYVQSEWNKWFDTLEDATSLSESSNDDTIILTRSGQGTVPIEVREAYEEADDGHKLYRVHFADYCSNDKPYLFQDHSGFRDTYVSLHSTRERQDHCVKRIRLTGKNTTRFYMSHDELFVPAEAKKFSLAPASDDCCEHSKKLPFELGDLADIRMALVQNLAPVKLRTDEVNVSVNDRSMNKESAFRHLVVDWCLRSEVADEMLAKSASSPRRDICFHLDLPAHKKAQQKQAYANLINSAPSAPGIPEPYISSNGLLGSTVPTSTREERNIVIDDMLPDGAARMRHRVVGPDANTMQVAQQAAQTGQREIFDTAILGSLLKTIRSDNMVDRFQPDLMKGMDRLGRIYFQFLWHGEEFESRYGKQDMPEIEDGLRNAFEAVGDIILVLKRKSVDPFADVGTQINLDSLAN